MNVTVIYGPQASGKTRYAEELRNHLGCKRVLDDEFTMVRRKSTYIPAHRAQLRDGEMILTNDERTADLLGKRNARVIHIDDALRSAGISTAGGHNA